MAHYIELVDLFSVDAAVEIHSVSKHPLSNDGKYFSKIGNTFLIPYHTKNLYPNPITLPALTWVIVDCLKEDPCQETSDKK